jgi:hypothetical protein
MSEEYKKTGPGPNVRAPQEVFSHGNRKKAVDVMRDRARRLKSQADHWNALADALDRIERYANEQCVDGNEAGPHIGVGSMAEGLLWELASKDWPQ